MANAGIAGNRILKARDGVSSLARFDRDVLSVPGARYLMLLQGINDIGYAREYDEAAPTTNDIVEGYRQMIARARAAGIRVILGTMTPIRGAGDEYYLPEGEQTRQEVNSWIRSSREPDAHVDFDAAVRDEDDPSLLCKAYEGDGLPFERCRLSGHGKRHRSTPVYRVIRAIALALRESSPGQDAHLKLRMLRFSSAIDRPIPKQRQAAVPTRP